MASHFSSIGIPVNSRDEFQDYFEMAYNRGEHIRVNKGVYLKWKVDSAIELWGQLNDKSEAIGMNPHFFGSTRMNVLIKERVIRPSDDELDGAFYAWTGKSEGDGYPLVFDTPDICTYDNIKLPQVVVLQLAAFAHDIKGYKSEEEYFNAQEGEMKFAVESFIPSGLFKPDGETTTPPAAQAIFSGRIIDTQKCTNAYTNKVYVWAKVSVLGDEIDVVADPEIIEGEMVNGGILSGLFWLTGRIVGDFQKQQKSFWQKIFGR